MEEEKGQRYVGHGIRWGGGEVYRDFNGANGTFADEWQTKSRQSNLSRDASTGLEKMYGHKCLAGESHAPGSGTEFNPSLLFSSSEGAVSRFVYEAASL